LADGLHDHDIGGGEIGAAVLSFPNDEIIASSSIFLLFGR
jgi:hypothetical protein